MIAGSHRKQTVTAPASSFILKSEAFLIEVHNVRGASLIVKTLEIADHKRVKRAVAEVLEILEKGTYFVLVC